MVLGVRYTCRGDDREEARLDELDEVAAKDHAAQVDNDIEAFRERGRLRNAVAQASETAQLRELLSDDRPA